MNIKKLVEDLKLTQLELAEIFGCSPSNVSNIVNGRRGLTGLQVRLLIEKFGYDVVASYSESDELPLRSVVSHNAGPVQNGNYMTASGSADEVIKSQAEVIRKQCESLALKDEQISRLLSIIEGMNEKK